MLRIFLPVRLMMRALQAEDSNGLSEYEIQRLERIKQNHERLKALQLVELAQEVAQDMAATRKAKVLRKQCVLTTYTSHHSNRHPQARACPENARPPRCPPAPPPASKTSPPKT